MCTLINWSTTLFVIRIAPYPSKNREEKIIELQKVSKFDDKNEELGLSYRNCKIKDEWYFLNARLKTKPGQKEEIQGRMKNIILNRKKSQPTGVKTGGSTFMNDKTFKLEIIFDNLPQTPNKQFQTIL